MSDASATRKTLLVEGVSFSVEMRAAKKRNPLDAGGHGDASADVELTGRPKVDRGLVDAIAGIDAACNDAVSSPASIGTAALTRR